MTRIVLDEPEYKALCTRIMIRDGYKCRVCKARNQLAPHHIIFRSQGGSDTSQNLITLCNTCHTAVHRVHLSLLAKDGSKNVDANKGISFIFKRKVKHAITLPPNDGPTRDPL